MSEAKETTPLQEEKEETGIGGCLCCRTVAPIRFGVLESNRHQVLQIAHMLCAVSLFLMAVGFIGAYSSGAVLSIFSWLTIYGKNGKSFAGVRHVCTPAQDGGWTCVPWSDFDCGAYKNSADYCELCKTQSLSLSLSVAIGCFTYYSFYKKTNARLNGEDSNCTKFMACFSAFFGGTNFLLAMVAYWQTCVRVADRIPDARVHAGLGCWCITLATILKLCMGVLHLGLPVEHPKDASV